MATASPITFTALSDNIASIVAFFQAHVIKETEGGMRKLANDLFDFVISADSSCDFVFSRRLLNACEQLPRMLALDGDLSQQSHIALLKAMNIHFGGVSTFALANSIQVAPEFKTVADAFLGIVIAKAAVFAPVTIMGQFINPTGYTQQDVIDPTVYPDADLVLEADDDIADFAATYDVTAVAGDGTSLVIPITVPSFTGQGTQFPIGAPNQFSSVTNVALTSGGNAGDSLTAKSLRLRALPFAP